MVSRIRCGIVPDITRRPHTELHACFANTWFAKSWFAESWFAESWFAKARPRASPLHLHSWFTHVEFLSHQQPIHGPEIILG
jgi:hypothetical protein